MSSNDYAARSLGVFVFLKNLASEVLNRILPSSAGTDQQVFQNNATTLQFQDLIIATKSVDNTTIPTDGQVLTFDNASGKIKFKAAASTTLSELQFLAQQASLGNLIMVDGGTGRTTTGVIISYTPPNGKTFSLAQADTEGHNNAIVTTIQLRNNTTVKETFSTPAVSIIIDHRFILRGDQLVGDGVKTYDLNVSATGTLALTGSITGYIA